MKKLSYLIINLFFVTCCMLQGNLNVLSADLKSMEEEKTYCIVCTPGAQNHRLKEIISSSPLPVIGLNLGKASNLIDPPSLFETPLPDLRYLKAKFKVEEIIKVLPAGAPNLEVLDIEGANLSDVTLLTQLSKLTSLKALDISRIHSSEKLSEALEFLLANNDHLRIYVHSLRKFSPTQKPFNFSVYDSNLRVIRKTYESSEDYSLSFVPSAKKYIY